MREPDGSVSEFSDADFRTEFTTADPLTRIDLEISRLDALIAQRGDYDRAVKDASPTTAMAFTREGLRAARQLVEA